MWNIELANDSPCLQEVSKVAVTKKNPLINHLINKHMNRPSDKTMAGIEALKKEGLLYALKGGLE